MGVVAAAARGFRGHVYSVRQYHSSRGALAGTMVSKSIVVPNSKCTAHRAVFKGGTQMTIGAAIISPLVLPGAGEQEFTRCIK